MPKLEVLRGSDRLQLDVSLAERPHKVDSLVDSVDPVKNLVLASRHSGIELNPDLAHSLPDLRIPSGIIVAAKTLGAGTTEVPLQTGDVIHGLNGTTVTSMADLREGLAKLAPGDAVVSADRAIRTTHLRLICDVENRLVSENIFVSASNSTHSRWIYLATCGGD